MRNHRESQIRCFLLRHSLYKNDKEQISDAAVLCFRSGRRSMTSAFVIVIWLENRKTNERSWPHRIRSLFDLNLTWMGRNQRNLCYLSLFIASTDDDIDPIRSISINQRLGPSPFVASLDNHRGESLSPSPPPFASTLFNEMMRLAMDIRGLEWSDLFTFPFWFCFSSILNAERRRRHKTDERNSIDRRLFK